MHTVALPARPREGNSSVCTCVCVCVSDIKGEGIFKCTLVQFVTTTLLNPILQQGCSNYMV